MPLAKFQVSFDDADPITVEVRESDMIRIEEYDPALAKDMALVKQRQAEYGKDWSPITPRRGYIMCYVALGRMKRTGKLPEGVEVPASLDEFFDVVAHVEGEDPGEPEGKADRQDQPPGS